MEKMSKREHLEGNKEKGQKTWKLSKGGIVYIFIIFKMKKSKYSFLAGFSFYTFR